MFRIDCTKNGKTFVHFYFPPSLNEALRVGHELVRDMEADFFRVVYLGR